VEAPGTAPGSEWFIAVFVYRHSRRKRRQIEYRGLWDFAKERHIALWMKAATAVTFVAAACV